MGEIVERLELFGEIALTDEVKAKLLAVSAATIDRLLAGERGKFELKGRSRTKPGNLLKSQTNLFLPAMKFIEKTRIGSRVTKKYDEAKTPCRRLLLSVDLPAKTKEGLQARYATLNPAELKRSILKLQDRLLNLSRLKEEIRRKKVLTAEDFEYISDEATNHQLGYIST